MSSSTAPALFWYRLQSLLEDTNIDCLLLFDFCHAAGSIEKCETSSVKEVLAGCGRESKAIGPGGGRVIGSPFTYTLTKYLEAGACRSHGFMMSELQTLMSFDEVLENQSPIHVVLSGHNNPINLKPLASRKEDERRSPRFTHPVWPRMRAMLADNLRGGLPSAEQFTQWLHTQRSEEVEAVDVTQIMTIEGIFQSNSTLMLISMSLSVWAHFGESPGCSLVGFVTSSNEMIKRNSNECVMELWEVLNFKIIGTSSVASGSKKRRVSVLQILQWCMTDHIFSTTACQPESSSRLSSVDL